MFQLGNTYTGKFKDIPKYLTINHLYYAYDEKKLYSFNADHTPYLLAPIDPDGSDKHYVHDQSSPCIKWECKHNLGKLPAIQIVDTSNRIVEGSVYHINENETTITFNSKFSGVATFN